MAEIERDGVDVDVALATTAQHLLKAPKSSSPPAGKKKRNMPAKPAAKSPAVRTVPAKRRLAGGVARVAKPVVRPFSRRIRSHLNEPVRADLRRGQQTNRAELKALRREVQALRRELAKSEKRQRKLIESVTWQVLQNVLAVKDFEPSISRAEQFAGTAANRVAVAGAPGEVLVRTSVGYVVCAAHDYPVLTTLFDVGELERGTRLLIERLLQPGDTFVDAGANVGMMSLAAGHALARQGHIIGFEPHPETHRLLEKSMALNGLGPLSEMHAAAVSNRPGTMQLFLGMASGHHSLFPLSEGVASSVDSIDVPVVRIDDVVDGRPVDLLKIDVEGAELEVVEGAASTIEANQHIALIVEFGISHLRRTDHTTARWLQAFESFGLEYRVIEPSDGTLQEWSPEQLESVESINLLFARPESRAWDRAQGVA